MPRRRTGASVLAIWRAASPGDIACAFERCPSGNGSGRRPSTARRGGALPLELASTGRQGGSNMTTDALTERLERCYTGVLHDEMRPMGLRNFVLPPEI